ncbi:MAG TPA: hypothetical protein VF042_02360 [Gemmatimonadaceae bacterium]
MMITRIVCAFAAFAIAAGTVDAQGSAPNPTKPIHHFVFFGMDRELIRTDSLFLNTPEIEGAQITYPWRRLEQGKDGYNFSMIREDLEFLSAHGKKLWIQFQDVTFNDKNNFVPKYMLDDTAYHGGAAQAYRIGANDESEAKTGGWVARRWDPAVQDRLNKLFVKLGDEFDGKIEGINLDETSLEYGSSGRLWPSGFTYESYRDAIIRNMKALKAAFPKSVAMQYANFMPGEWRPSENKGYLDSVYSAAIASHVAVGGPDILPYRPGQRRGAHPLIQSAAGRVPTGLAVQDGNLAEINPETKKKTTAVELLDYAVNNLHLDYIFWGREEPYYSDEVIPLLRKH